MRITFTCSKKFKVGFTLKANTAFTMYNSGNLYINFIMSNKTESLLWKKERYIATSNFLQDKQKYKWFVIYIYIVQ